MRHIPITFDRMLVRRIVMALLGMLITGISIGFFKRSMFGVDPYQCFANGLHNGARHFVNIDYGTTYMLINLIQLVVVLFLDRRHISVTTFINIFLLGYMAEFSENTLARMFGDLNMPWRIAFLLIGVVTTCFAAALYYSAHLGVSTYDAIPLYIADQKPKVFGRVVPFRAVRIVCDLICTGVGVALGARAGVGTVITALFMGPLITFFRRTVSEPLMHRELNK